MHYFVLLMKFDYLNGPTKALDALNKNFKELNPTISVQLSKDKLHAFFVVSSANPFDKNIIRVFRINKKANILFSYCTDGSALNFFASGALHNFTQWERLNIAPKYRTQASIFLSDTGFSEWVRTSEFRPTHSVVVLEQPVPIDPKSSAAILAMLKSTNTNQVFVFNSAALEVAK